ncbi:hypothetical protein M3936_19140 [Sutcliffiella horikoshii]|uniref:hypothetical protein n=1 Tax=Sutcliffiella horikoshii TaxID=79883 RepID=UPI00203C5817|nr:hypothetical protein [Sutcliffiella horikoshii]MCM3619689.1 hypothetical protein [Sutcliffiella horikoshii]
MLGTSLEHLISLDILPFYIIVVAVLLVANIIKNKFGEVREDQIKKLHKIYGKQNIKEIEMIDRSPREYTKFMVRTLTNTEIITMVPGYKIKERFEV